MTASAISTEVRAELEDLLERDLLGPWDGPEEELPPGTLPAERYLLGRLVPQVTSGAPAPPAADVLDVDPATVDREVVASADVDDTDVEPEATVRAGTMAACSLGLSFSVPAEVDAVTVGAGCGVATSSAARRCTRPSRASPAWSGGGSPPGAPSTST